MRRPSTVPRAPTPPGSPDPRVPGWLVVGLGNPGPTYAGHRHNVGYLVADVLAERIGARFSAPKALRAELAEGRLGPIGPDSVKLAIMKSRTYMNDTGGATAKALSYFGIGADRMIAIHDELDIDPGQIRVKFGGGDNGHNGLKSIRRSLGTGDYFRVRVGVGRPPGRQEPADFLLSNFSAAERADLGVEVERAADAVESLVTVGLERTQSAYNS